MRQASILCECIDARMDELLRLGNGRTVSREYWGELVELRVLLLLGAVGRAKKIGPTVAPLKPVDQ